MIRKLRIKFILVSMFSMLLVLSVILGIVNVLNYDEIVHDADSVLALLNAHAASCPCRCRPLTGEAPATATSPPNCPMNPLLFGRAGRHGKCAGHL